ncbi:MAG TPA: VWA domain-containing protein [Blastocatellia bacterium]|nr:VWA domain-containing protein [Blastocatellia bacterium]
MKKTLKKHLKGATSSTIESLAKRIGFLPGERVMLTTDIGIALAATSLRVAIEFLKSAPEVSRLIDAGEMKAWGEIGRRLSATSAETASDFFQSSAAVLQATPAEMRPAILRLTSKQAALSANTAVECFKCSSEIIDSIGNPLRSATILDICLELARHSVKHSYDLFRAAPAVISQLASASAALPLSEGSELVERALTMTSTFAYRSGGTAAEFFTELPRLTSAAGAHAARESLDKLFSNTEAYLERSGGVALQYYKAASRILLVAGTDAFERWTSLAERVAAQGNAASYHFMKASPQIVADLSARAGKDRRAEVVSAVLEAVSEIGEKNPPAAVECFRASPAALAAATLGQFREWARRGIESSDDPRRIQAYYALESKGSQEALFRIEGGLTLDSVAQTLRLYVEGLTGRGLNIAPVGSIPEETRIGDGKTVFLPSVVAEFENEAENFRLFKVLAAHAAGQVEFDTYVEDSPALLAALADARDAFGSAAGDNNRSGKKALAGDEPGDAGIEKKTASRPKAAKLTSAREGTGGRKKGARKGVPAGINFTTVLSQFPNQELAMRLFTTLENGRIDYLLRHNYRGIRRDLDFVQARLKEHRPGLANLHPELLPFELLFQIAVCGSATDEARNAYPTVVARIEDIVGELVRREYATVGDSLTAARLVYKILAERPREDQPQSEDSDSGSDGEAAAGNASQQEQSEDGGQSRQPLEVRQDPLSFWASGLAQDADADAQMQNQFRSADSPEHDLERGDRAFYYDEWDRELGDYRTRWCRVIERITARGSRGFVEMVRSRYSGVISSIRYQFQMLRPENLSKIRGEIDGDDYDLQAVIDYALDKRATGLIDERLYTRKLRRERDVAVSFLLDMSSSTARTISRDPARPYTQPGQRIIDIEKEGLVLMSEALEAVGDVYSMQGFTSEGRRNVKFYVIKDFSEPYSSDIERRIGGITYQNNTRLGAAIRHAAARLVSRDARTKLLIVLSDGRPYDHDYGDSRYAREDTRMALRQARLSGITPFCITIDRESEDQLRDMYGEVGYTIIDEVLSLPERLPGIYSRLTT